MTKRKGRAVLNREPLFELGDIGVTQWAAQVLEAAGLHPVDVIARHVTGDWGTFNDDPDQVRENVAGIEDGGRILSDYQDEAASTRHAAPLVDGQRGHLPGAHPDDRLHVARSPRAVA